MDADLIVMTAVTLLYAAGVVVIALLPAWIAWLIAWRSGMPKPHRRSFALVCLLLSYGVMMMAGALLLPLAVLQIFTPPDLHERGHVALANGIFFVAEQGAPIISFTAGLIAAIGIPVKLRRNWTAITATFSLSADPINSC